MKDVIIRWAEELQNVAQIGLAYAKDPFDIERYQRIREISVEMMALRTDIPAETVKGLFCSDIGYQTPKVDTRAAIFQDGKILLVHEKNGTWSLPGGWCEYNMSPMENVVKETREEAGLEVDAVKLIAVQNRDAHNEPAYAYGVVKIFYLCKIISGHFCPNLETIGSEFFEEDNLPAMAMEKCNEEQIKICFDAYRSDKWEAQFD